MLREHDRVDFKFSATFPMVRHLRIRDASQIDAAHDEQNER